MNKKNSKHNFSLIDIMNGIDVLALYNKIPGTPFRFFIGLICKANALRFKKTIELTCLDAMHLGAGSTRQAVHQVRQKLCDVCIDGESILKVKAGNVGRNASAKYQINYSLLIRQTRVNLQFADLSSTEIDDFTDVYHEKPIETSTEIDDFMTTLRQTDREKEKLKQKESLQEDEYPPPSNDQILIRKLQNKYQGKFKLTVSSANKMLNSIAGANVEFWCHVINRMPTKYDDVDIPYVGGVIKYGERIWPDYKKQHNIQSFF